MVYRKAVIYFLSGTGNSYRVSTWLEQQATAAGLETKICSVNNAHPQQEIADSGETLLGLVFPTHGFTAPWHMIKFAAKLPRRKTTQAFCMATRAGLRFGKVFLPGISVSATFLISLILFLKGYRVRGVTAIDMPSNWYSLHPIQRTGSIERIKKRATSKVRKSMARLLQGRRMWLTWNNLYETIWGIPLSYISLLYLLVGRFFLAKLFFANRDCDGCGICAVNCPVGAIQMQGVDGQWPFWRYNCESCMKCAAFCPKNAIEAGHSWAVVLWILTSWPGAVFMLNQLNLVLPGVEHSPGTWMASVIDLAFFYLALIISYFIFSRLLRIPFINRIFTLTTFTHLPFWGRYREPDTKIKHLRDKKGDDKVVAE